MIKRLLFFVGVILLMTESAKACTNLIVTKGASADGSTMLFYANDGEYIPVLPIHAGQRWSKRDSVELISWPNGVRANIPQPKKSYTALGYHINEYQVAIGETTFGGRHELHNRSVAQEYWHLMEEAVRRAKTAKEAVHIIIDLVEQYGYGSEGESFSIVDPNEAWLLEMIGKGEGSHGALYVAQRIPDGMVVAHANHSRISSFPMNDPENCIYSHDVVSFAVEKGYYDPKSGKPFEFNSAYDPVSPAKLRYCESRVYSLYHRMAPSMDLSSDYCRGVQGAEAYPLWIKPDEKISLKNMMSLVRDHYEGMPWDMRKGIASGAYGSPNYARPMTWKVDDTTCSWERPISTPVTAYSFIAQLRADLPREVGALMWYGLDNNYTNCYMPVYVSSTKMPVAFNTGDINKFSWSSAWWVFNFVGNYVNLRYNDMVKDVQKKQSAIESELIDQQATFEAKVVAELKKNKKGAIEMMTDYTNNTAESVVADWIDLGQFLIMKYNDGYVKDEQNRIKQKGASESYYRKVLKDDPERKLPVWDQQEEHNEKEPSNF
ncbi:dipeptidase [Persicobacter psychrovividus]|uniref:Dipeptidase n=1 Tax=Persicobacter psychrovividus TaxID=387638 RepID=A0ABM7VLB4_9BACT|nr:dipeptidase [Persicobacter psychrovividus]